jgi:NDP-sugar pyrophosphorylase family protein
MSFHLSPIIINVHHFADRIISFIDEHNRFEADIRISREEVLLDTGGALKKALPLFKPKTPLLVHNVDAITDLNLHDLFSYHLADSDTIATTAVRDRDTNRHLLFDSNNRLCGWRSKKPPVRKIVRDSNESLQPLSFMGIYVLSPEFLNHFPGEEKFSIIPMFLDLARDGKKILGYRGDQSRWIDVGTLEKLKRAETFFGKDYFHNPGPEAV